MNLDGYGGAFLFNADPLLLHRAADEAQACMSVLLMCRSDASQLAGHFQIFAHLFRERAENPNPDPQDAGMLTVTDSATTEHVLELLAGLAGRPEAPASEVWRQLRSAIVARERARHPDGELDR